MSRQEKPTPPRTVFASGVFDLLHSGHIAFFKEAASYGDLYIAVGSDQTVYGLRGRPPANNEDERLFMVRAVSYVKDAFISRSTGILDFEQELRELKPDVFVVTDDANLPAKRLLAQELGIEYVVLKREPHAGLPYRSSAALRSVDQMPYRIDLAGGWLDQPYVSRHHPGSVITISIEPTVNFNERSGMATSTRNHALDLWGYRLPADDPEKLAYILFCYDNPPGTQTISGSQDAIGIAMPALNKAYYEGKYWPSRFDTCRDELTLQFVEKALYLVPLDPRAPGYDVLADTYINRDGAKRLADATEACWRAILARDLRAFGQHMRESFDAQVAMFPSMMNHMLGDMIEQYRDRALGWKVSGAGGGGYLILVADKPIESGFQIIARRGFE